MRDLHAIVIGGGVMGTAAARWLVARGHETLLLERFEIGNAFVGYLRNVARVGDANDLDVAAG